MRIFLIFLAAPFLVLFFVSSAFAPTDPIPHMINYQGMLTNDEGTPLNGLYDLTFRIYDVPSGGTALWTGNYNDEDLQDGLFNVILEIPASVFNGAERYMGITVWPDAELSPRTRLTSVGYAYVAETAVTSGTDGDWTISGDNIYSAVSGKVGIGTTSPAAKLDVDGSGQSYAIQAQGGSSYSIRGEWGGSSLGAAVLAKNTGTGGDAIQAMAEGSGRSAVWARGNTGVDYAIYGSANGATWAGYFSGDVYTSGDLTVGGTIGGKVPGVGTLVGQTSINVPTTAAALISKSINVPGAGQVMATCTGSVNFAGLADASSYMIRLKLNEGTSANTTEDGYVIFIRDTHSNMGTRTVPFAISRVFQAVGPGTFIVNLTGWLQVAPAVYDHVTLDDRVLTLLYVPTTY